jgi:HD-GYP domain-containing protein (c-di-GMP phosphodiesterase class II)
MIEIPIDYVTPGDVLGKYHTFRKYEMGMTSNVDLERGYCLTDRVIRKLKREYRVQYLSIEEPTPELKDINFVEPCDEASRQQGISTIIRGMKKVKTSKVLDLRVFGAVVEDILGNVNNILKNGKGSFKVLSNTFERVQSHDFFTWEHSVNTAIYAAIIALSVPRTFESMGISYSIGRTSRLENLVLNMLLHDIGKIKIPEGILNKPGRIDESELVLVKKHPTYGVAYIREINVELERSGLPWIPSYLMQACLTHHQAFDGSGYPPLRTRDGEVRQLAGLEIPLIGRIAAVADVYDAVSSVRPFRSPFHPIDAIRILRKEEGRRLDPGLTEAFIERIYPYPIGSTVVLSTEELSVVVGYDNDDKFRPLVRPIMKKIMKGAREEVVRLPWTQQQNMTVAPESKVKIIVNKEIYQLEDDYRTSDGIQP